MNEQGASDLHLVAGQPPALRIRGDIERIKYKVLNNDDLRGMLYEISPEEKIKVFEETGRYRDWPVTGPIFSCRKMGSALFSGKYPAPS
jgi:Tfp pilus assembly pilus retraction ATPase PilT